MTAPSSIDPPQFLHEHLAQASPDLMRDMLATFINALLSADADAVCGAGYREVSEAPGEPAQRLPPPRFRHPRRHRRRRHPQVALGVVLPRVGLLRAAAGPRAP